MGLPLHCIADETLLKAAKEGDPDSFFALYDRYKNRVMRFAHILLSDEKRSGEVVKTCFLNFLKEFAQYDEKVTLIVNFLKVTRDLSLSIIKESSDTSKRGELVSRESTTSDGQSDKPEGADFGPALRAAFSSLPIHQAEVLYLALVEGLSYAHMSIVLGCPEETVIVRLNEAMNAFRDALQRQGLFNEQSESPTPQPNGGVQNG